jgi:hypothetical protein
MTLIKHLHNLRAMNIYFYIFWWSLTFRQILVRLLPCFVSFALIEFKELRKMYSNNFSHSMDTYETEHTQYLYYTVITHKFQ